MYKRQAPLSPNVPSYPGFPFRLGSAGNFVRQLKVQLNRIDVYKRQVLVFTFTLIPTVMYAERTINNDFVGQYFKEEITNQMTETITENLEGLSEEEYLSLIHISTITTNA